MLTERWNRALDQLYLLVTERHAARLVSRTEDWFRQGDPGVEYKNKM